MLGIPDKEEALEGATTDAEKIRRFSSEIGEDTRIYGLHRIGRRDANINRKRPVLVQLENKEIIDAMLRKA